jgi:hypothetical protein
MGWVRGRVLVGAGRNRCRSSHEPCSLNIWYNALMCISILHRYGSVCVSLQINRFICVFYRLLHLVWLESRPCVMEENMKKRINQLQVCTNVCIYSILSIHMCWFMCIDIFCWEVCIFTTCICKICMYRQWWSFWNEKSFWPSVWRILRKEFRENFLAEACVDKKNGSSITV